MPDPPETDFAEEIHDADAPKDTDGVPYCPVHHCRMKQSSGGRKGNPKIYYTCKVPECKETGQRLKLRNDAVVPSQPVTCCRCSKGKESVFCERSKLSTAAYVILQCPRCGWKSGTLPKPLFADRDLANRNQPPRPADIGDR